MNPKHTVSEGFVNWVDLTQCGQLANECQLIIQNSGSTQGVPDCE
jgi:hypothetical protein